MNHNDQKKQMQLVIKTRINTSSLICSSMDNVMLQFLTLSHARHYFMPVNVILCQCAVSSPLFIKFDYGVDQTHVINPFLRYSLLE